MKINVEVDAKISYVIVEEVKIMTNEQNNQSITKHQALVEWIESSMDYELQDILEGLGYHNKHHLASTIIKFSPKPKPLVTKRRNQHAG